MKMLKTEEDRDRANLIFQICVAIAVIFMNIGIVVIIAVVDVPDENDAAFNIFLGNALGWMSALIAFGFPNSIGTAKKDDTINKLADKTPPVTVPKEDLTYGPVVAEGQAISSLTGIGDASTSNRAEHAAGHPTTDADAAPSNRTPKTG